MVRVVLALALALVGCRSDRMERGEKRAEPAPREAVRDDREPDLPPELAFTCEKLVPRAMREELFPEGKDLRGSGKGKASFYECTLTTDHGDLVVAVDCDRQQRPISWVGTKCDRELLRGTFPHRKVVPVGRVACDDETDLEFVPRGLDCRVRIYLVDDELRLALAKALDEVYSKATVSR